MIKRYNRTCQRCKQYKPVQYYIHHWQKKYMYPLPFPYCEECAKVKDGIVLYSVWISMIDALECRALRNNAELS